MCIHDCCAVSDACIYSLFCSCNPCFVVLTAFCSYIRYQLQYKPSLHLQSVPYIILTFLFLFPLYKHIESLDGFYFFILIHHGIELFIFKLYLFTFLNLSKVSIVLQGKKQIKKKYIMRKTHNRVKGNNWNFKSVKSPN